MMAINKGDLKLLTGIVTGKVSFPKPKNDWVDLREVAICALGHERFRKEEVLPVLRKLIRSEYPTVSEGARSVLKRVAEQVYESAELYGKGEQPWK